MTDANGAKSTDHAAVHEAHERAVLVKMSSIHKSFGPVEVLRGVDFTIRAGDVHLLAGENGAGKSTLLKILGGVHTSFEGTIEINGHPARPRSPHHAETLGVAMIHQELSLVPTMSVADNIMLGRYPTAAGFVRRRHSMIAVHEALELVGLDTLDPRRTVGELPIAVQQLIEIAKAIRLNASVIVMDEPTSALNAPDVDALFALIKQLANAGRGVVFISHRMEELRRIGDSITILRDGASVASGPLHEYPEEDIIRHMLGREAKQEPLRDDEKTIGDERLRIDSLSVLASGRGVALQDISLTLGAGEIIGLAGLQGGGASELLNCLFGAWGTIASGAVRINGRPYRPTSPRNAIHHGFALLTNDRKATGLVMSMSVSQNATLAMLPNITRFGWRQPNVERDLTDMTCGQLNVRMPANDPLIPTLSGGNQQKVALAKWMLTKPRVLLLDEPTRGVDIGAKQDIYKLMRQWTDQGVSILLVTSELPELLMLSDRIIVLHRGCVSARFERDEATPETVLAAAMGRTQEESPAS